MKKFLLFIFLLVHMVSFATHERAGEITYRHIGGLTYEVTITTFTYSPSPADRPELEIKWGDGTTAILPRSVKEDITPVIRRNQYVGVHTYSGPASYRISVEDPNRNDGIVNIPNSVNIPFYIETELVINPFLGFNNSVQLLNPPLDYGCIQKPYIHNPAAWDPDGDSLSYKLTICRGAEGEPIPGFVYPFASDVFMIDAYTGNLLWDSPVLQGEYNVAFIIEEWRLGQRVGYVTRDMQILIDACDNNPPVINTVTDTCVEAGSVLTFMIYVEDQDQDIITTTATGGPFEVTSSPAVIIPEPAVGDTYDTLQFVWQTNCTHILKNPYNVYIKCKDNGYPVNLSQYKNISITVVGPPPQNFAASALANNINLSWDDYACPNATGYKIYRKSGFYGFEPGYCETGVPAYTGYEQIATLFNPGITQYTDNNNGAGLIHGIEYCYMITATFSDGAESYASEEVCALLKRDVPVITNVSINTTSPENGSVYTAWSKPTELDFNQTPGPFRYDVYRKPAQSVSDPVLVQSYTDLNDTIFVDTLIDTETTGYSYKVEFFNTTPGNTFYIGSTQEPLSVFLGVIPSDKQLTLQWNNNVPWTNDTFVVYRQDPITTLFDSIGWTGTTSFTDTGLINNKEYCYKIKSIGQYSAPGLINPVINYSQFACGKPVDNVPPCTPLLSIYSDCFTLRNELSISYPGSCTDEPLKYYIYYASDESSDYSLIDSTFDELYIFDDPSGSIVGCFAVTALDTLWNESTFSNAACADIDACGSLYFPNVFTPNGDNRNETFRADSVHSVREIDLKIFNRWGTIVYETVDPYFQWDGRDQETGKECAEGVYFFECIVRELTLKGPRDRRIKGSVNLFRAE